MTHHDRISGVFSVTPTQRGILLGADGTGRQEAHIAHVICRLAGNLDMAAFERAWQRTVDRHSVLRTGFVWNDLPQVFQVVRATAKLRVEVLDGPHAVESFLAQNQRRGFDLARPPLMRVAVAQRGAGQADLVWCHHHSIIDGWSLLLVLAEVMEHYRADRTGGVPALGPAVAFDAFVQWLDRRDRAADATFWREALGGFEEPILFGRVRQPAANGFGVHAWTLTPELARLTLEAARRRRITPAFMIQAVWALVLAKFTGRRDIVIGITSSGRPASLPGCDQIVGPFLVTQPLRLRIVSDAEVDRWLTEGAQTAFRMAMHEHADPMIVRSCAAVPLGQPLFESVAVVQNYSDAASCLEADGLVLDLAEVRIEGGQGSYPLVLMAHPGASFDLRLVYDRRRFKDTEARILAQGVTDTLHALAQADHRMLADILAAMPAICEENRHSPPLPRPLAAVPRDTVEAQVAAVCTELTGLPVALEERFFEHGGHSLLALELSVRLARAFDVEVPVSWVFEAGTPRALADRLRKATAAISKWPTIARDLANRHAPFPLTDVQRAYWVGRNSELELGGFGSFCLVEIAVSTADVQAIEKAWNRLVKHHPMLRAVVTADGYQQVLPEVPWSRLERCKLNEVSGPAREEALKNLRECLRSRVADPTVWPLFALGFSDLGIDGCRLHVAYDPIVCDAGSLRLLANELALLAANPAAALPQPALDFRDYVLGLETLRRGPFGERARSYWTQRLQSLPPAPALPTAISSAGERFTRRHLDLAPESWAAIKALCSAAEVTPSSLLLAVYASVVAAWSRSRHFTLNVTLFNRVPLYTDVSHLVGDFTSLTLLEVDARPCQSLIELARVVHRQLLTDLDHRIIDGVEVMRSLASRDASGPVLMPVVFTSTLGQEDLEPPHASLGELVHGYGQTPQVYLDCQVGEWAGTLHCWWDCLDGCLAPGVADAMFEAFGGIFHQLSKHADAAHQPVPALASAEIRAGRSALNVTSAVPEQTLHGLFLQRAACGAAAPALIAPELMLTYGDLRIFSGRMAAQLCKAPASTSELVAILARNGWYQAVASLGVMWAGKGFVRIDPDWPTGRRALVLRTSGAATALVEPGLQLELPEGVSRLEVDPRIDDGVGLFEPIARPDSVAYVMFTSGSTGTPKGVTISHKAAINTILDINHRLEVQPRDRILAVSSATFDLSIYDLFGMLAAGGAMVCVAPTSRPDPATWLASIVQNRVTLWNSTPAVMEMLAEHAASSDTALLENLRAVLLSGDWIPLSLPKRVRCLAPNAKVIGLGGATEAAIWSVWQPIEIAEPDWPSFPYGAPLANQTVHVLDDRLEDRPDWVTGDLYIGGVGLANGYWNRSDLTEAAFVMRPSTGERLYRTGDLARFRPGAKLEFLGRQDGQVKVRGNRIELGEIESVLGGHPEVGAAVALTDQRGLHVYAAPRYGGQPPDPETLRQHLVAALPSYMVPSQVRIIEQLPLTANGKVDRTALLGMAKPSAIVDLTRPSTAMSEIVAGVAAELLGLEQLAPDADFFAAGGDSVSAMQLASRLRGITGKQVALVLIFEARTPHAIAAALNGTYVVAQTGGIPRAPTDRISASTAQRRLWVLDRLHPGDRRYIVAGALDLRGALDTAALTAAVAELMHRHEPLRTTLSEVDHDLVQVIHPVPDPAVAAAYCSETKKALAASFFEFASVPFDLSRDMPTRFRLLRISSERSVLQFSIHHVACDAWSLGVIADELSRLYAAYRGTGPSLPPLPVRYADFAAWEQRLHSPDNLARLRKWWSTALAGLTLQGLPGTGRNGLAGDTVIPIEIGIRETARLRACARRTGATLYMVLLAIFGATLRRQGASSDLAIASSVTGRDHPDLAPLVGCFVNLLLIRIDASGDPGLDELVVRVRDFAVPALGHQELPFEAITNIARPSGSDHAPPFTAVFVLQNAPRRRLTLDGIKVDMPNYDFGLSRYPLHLHLTEDEEGLHGALRCNGALIQREQASALAQRFRLLCELASAQPDASLLRLLDRAEEVNPHRSLHQDRLNRTRRRRASSVEGRRLS